MPARNNKPRSNKAAITKISNNSPLLGAPFLVAQQRAVDI
jgi:hypothetical protein